jgi:hypothetical protein
VKRRWTPGVLKLKVIQVKPSSHRRRITPFGHEAVSATEQHFSQILGYTLRALVLRVLR